MCEKLRILKWYANLFDTGEITRTILLLVFNCYLSMISKYSIKERNLVKNKIIELEICTIIKYLI